MTETDWLNAVEPDKMRDFLRLKKLASERKLRLFTAAACRRIWPLLADERSRRAVEVAERFADGLVSTWEVQAAEEDAERAADEVEEVAVGAASLASGPIPGATFLVDGQTAASIAARAASTASEHPFFIAASARSCADAASWNDTHRESDLLRREVERAAQAVLLRDIFPNPFRIKPSIPAAALAWNDGCVVKLARAIYDEGTFDRLPVLGDALEEAGVTDEAILGHCRDSTDVHVRGCWLLDLLLDHS
jgi:hypothetical protein